MRNLLITIIRFLVLGVILIGGYAITFSIFSQDEFCDSKTIESSFLIFTFIVFITIGIYGNKAFKNTEEPSIYQTLISIVGLLASIVGIFGAIGTAGQLLATFAGWGC